MSEYISKEDAINAMCRRCAVNCPPNRCAEYRSLAEDIAAVIPADVKPVVRGEWEEIDRDAMGEKTLQCNKCGKRTRSFFEPNFCPNCGADMRERSKKR